MPNEPLCRHDEVGGRDDGRADAYSDDHASQPGGNSHTEYLVDEILADEAATSRKGSFQKSDEKTQYGKSIASPVNVEEGRKEEAAAPHRHNWLSRVVNLIIPRGGLWSGVFNLASVTLGAGIISIPSAFNTSGIIMATVYLVVVTLLTVYSISLIATAAEKTGLRSFESMSRALFGRGGDVFTALLMWLLCFGGAVGYVIAVFSVVKTIFSRESMPRYIRSTAGHRCVVSAIWLCIMFPLCIPKQVNSLRYASACGVCFIIFFVICLVVHSAMNAFKDGFRDDLILVHTGNSGISGLSIFMFAYLCQVNSFKIHYETPDRSVRKLTLQAAISCAICGTLYFLTGFFGYCEFGQSLTGDILQYFDPYKNVIFFVCYVGIVIKLCAAFSLNMLACRTALFQVLHWNIDTMSYVKHTIVSTIFAVAALVLGLFISDVNIVFGLVGSFCGGFIAFAFPALFVMYSGNWSLQTVGIYHYLATYFLLLCGVIAIVFGTGSSIYDTVIKFS